MNAAERDARVDTEIVAPLRGGELRSSTSCTARGSRPRSKRRWIGTSCTPRGRRALRGSAARAGSAWLWRAGIAASAALAAAIVVRATRAPRPTAGRVVSQRIGGERAGAECARACSFPISGARRRSRPR